ncbi:MAG TPA: hypothetical protein VEI97_10185, partial [bacterium]|nr:hypothetical protein [bacterium]
NGTTILRFNGFEAYDQPTRTSRPVASSTVMTLPVGQIVGMVYVPLEGAPFVVGGTQQTTDWLVVLTRDTAGYALRALDANAPWTEVASENGTIEGWGSLFPLIVDIDFDPVSRLLMLSYDSNGITSGGSILVTALTPQ